LSGSSPLTCLAWEALPVAYTTASIAPGDHVTIQAPPSVGQHILVINIKNSATFRFSSTIIRPNIRQGTGTFSECMQ
jgi:hypothetical protein